jgi:hypothetical protein
MNDLMMLYGVTLGRRYTKKQKTYFVSEISETYPELGFSVNSEERKKCMSGGNIIAGDINKADTVFAAAYDTPVKSILPGYKYYPFHIEKNLKQERLNLVAQLLSSMVFALAAYVCLREFYYREGSYKAVFLFLTVLFIFGMWIIFMAKPNIVNFNRNSASLAVMAKIARGCKGNPKVAFVFMDKEVSSFDGLRELQKDYAISGKTLIVLDSIAYGEKLIVAHREEGREQAKQMLQLAEHHHLDAMDREYNWDKAQKNVLAFAENMLYIVSGTIENKEFVVKSTKSKKDMQVDIPRLDAIAQVCINFLSASR